MRLKYLILLMVLVFSACKKDVKPTKNVDIPSLKEVEITDSIITKADEGFFEEKSPSKVEQLEALRNDIPPKQIIIDKRILQENNKTELDFYYPFLNEELNTKYSSYNNYIKSAIVDKTIALMRENEAFIPLCDSVETRKQKSLINYSVKETQKVLSTVFVIENYYSGSVKNSISFKTVNYDFNNFNIINYNDYFTQNSEKEVLKILNAIIRTSIDSGDMYYDCWEISEKDFETYKNNFAVENESIRFYFDDCVVCPSYTGTYFVEVNSKQLKPFIKSSYTIQPDFDANL